MRHKVLCGIVLALLVSSAYAGTTGVAVFSFVCNGTKTGPCPNGAAPNSIIQASDGNFYGTTANSGLRTTGQAVLGGTLFSLTPAGKFTLLHTFTGGANGKFTNGATPVSLTEGPDGKLYGLASDGGNGFSAQFFGYGVAFRVNKSGTGFQVLHRFCTGGSSCTDGAYSAGSLMVGSDGNVYGATNQGGTGSGCGSSGCGVIFRIVPSSGAYEVVFNFSTVEAGGFPNALAPASDGSFYGLTINGNGLFHFTPANGSLQSMTLPFPIPAGCPGLACFAANVLAFGPSGNLYGFYTVYDIAGVSGLFEVGPDGSNLQLFPEFTTTTGNGPQLLSASDGNLWFPQATGSSKNGNLVAISPITGNVAQTLSPFSSSVFAPVQIIQVADGTLWGVASGGVVTSGHFGGGTVFHVNAGLPPR